MPARGKRAEIEIPATVRRLPLALDELTGDAQRVTHGEVALDLIDPDPRNPERRSQDVDEEFLADIATNGVITPVLLRPNPTVPGRWLLVAGHRRVTHASAAGFLEVPATMLPPTEDLPALRRLVAENIQRADLTVSEEAALVQEFLDLGVDEAALTTELHKSATWVRSRRSVARMPRGVQAQVDGKQMTLADVARLDKFVDDEKTLTKLVEGYGSYNWEWALREAESKRADAELMSELRERLGALGVSVVRTGKKHRIDGENPTHEVLAWVGPHPYWTYGTVTPPQIARDDLEKKVPGLAGERELSAIARGSRHYLLIAPLAAVAEETAAQRRKREKDAAAAAEDERIVAAAADASALAHLLRRDFLCSFLTGQRQLTAKQMGTLATLVTHYFIGGHSLDTYRRGCTAGEWLAAAGRPVATSEIEHARAAVDMLPAGAGLVLLLAMLVERIASDDWNGYGWWPAGLSPICWRDGFPDDSHRTTGTHKPWNDTHAYYALLEELGYQPSDTERAALAGAWTAPPAPQAEG